MNTYKPLLRPAGSATLPDDIEWTFVEAPDYLPMAPAPRSSYPHGIIETNRPLTDAECMTFDLQPA